MYAFNQPYLTGKEQNYITEALAGGRLQSGSAFDAEIKKLLQDALGAEDIFLVHSCTAALELSALAIDIQPGDEVIMPSYTYVSTANAFALRGADIIFVAVDSRTMCIDLDAVEAALTEKTKAVVPVHYGSASCDMDRLMRLSATHGFWVVEDAAQALFAHYKGRALGTIGHFGCFSCHETKNIHAGGEGGILSVNDHRWFQSVAQLIEKGTDRKAFLDKRVSRYTWQTLGSSYGMSGLHSAFLWGQLEHYKEITAHRRMLFNTYVTLLSEMASIHFDLFFLPEYNDGNGHLCYIKTLKVADRDLLKNHMAEHGIEALSHYEPLHASPGGLKYGRFVGEDTETVEGAKRLLRLPLHMALTHEDVRSICHVVSTFYKQER
ncbi:MAG: dTDP-4-amino-4,6-dideoxygalactose transaminase [Clostridia bacterium]|nr:dTDP-4-amino-4,6-dideoxygalactose transaminase [Clostridia bacterium]